MYTHLYTGAIPPMGALLIALVLALVLRHVAIVAKVQGTQGVKIFSALKNQGKVWHQKFGRIVIIT